jgi:hypothetical protein
MIATKQNEQQRIKDGIIWTEHGEAVSSGALLERLAHAVKRSGGEKTTVSTIRPIWGEKFDPAKAEFQNWFNNREVLSSSGQHLRITDCTFGRYVDVLGEIPGIQSFLLCLLNSGWGEECHVYWV